MSRRLVTAWAAAAVATLSQIVGAQTRLNDPDFKGLFSLGTPVRAVARDSVQGWNYLLAGNTMQIDGVSVGKIARVNDAGIVDTGWLLDKLFAWERIALDGDGNVFATDTSGRWYRLVQRIGRGVDAAPLLATEAPPERAFATFAWYDAINRASVTLNGADGSALRIDLQRPIAPAFAAGATLSRTSSRDTVGWTAAVEGQLFSVAMDAVGRVYLFGNELKVDAKRGNLLRVLGNGTVDTHWEAPDITASSYDSNALRVVGDRLVLVAQQHSGSALPVSALQVRTFSLERGTQIGERIVPQSGPAYVAADGSVLAATGVRPLLLRAMQASIPSVDIPALLGTEAKIHTVKRWGEYVVVGGDFEFWQSGVRYRNLLRLGTNFRVDPAWQPNPERKVRVLTVNREGGLVVGSESARGQDSGLLRFTRDGVVDTSWTPSVWGPVYSMAAGADGALFIGGLFDRVNDASRSALAKFLPDGSLDAEWASAPTWPPIGGGALESLVNGVVSIVDAGAGGLLFSWVENGLNSSNSGLIRVERSGLGAPLRQPQSFGGSDWFLAGLHQDAFAGHMYAQLIYNTPFGGSYIVRLKPDTLELDPAWPRYTASRGAVLVAFSETHFYMVDRSSTQGAYRVEKVTGQTDPQWSLGSAVSGAAGLLNTTDASGLGKTLIWNNFSNPLQVLSDQTVNNEARTVVEYFSRAANRFFITARGNEQRLLDELAPNFVRTGMQFAAYDGAGVPTSSLLSPVCRFYAAPSVGGSNTHFYGHNHDCQLLNRFVALQYEGYDFAVATPTGGNCGNFAPIAVYRMLSPTTSGGSHHRYVVSTLRRNEMIDRGWRDEGLSFCTANAMDAAASNGF